MSETVRKIFKLILIGDGGVGKTSLRRNFLGFNFKKQYQMTLGADFAVKSIEVNDYHVTLQIWDLAGQERFSVIRDRYYKDSQGVILVYDLTIRETYENIPKWIAEYMKNTDNVFVPFLIIGNKNDILDKVPRQVDEANVKDYIIKLREWGQQSPNFSLEYIETSAKTGYNIEDAFAKISSMMINN